MIALELIADQLERQAEQNQLIAHALRAIERQLASRQAPPDSAEGSVIKLSTFKARRARPSKSAAE